MFSMLYIPRSRDENLIEYNINVFNIFRFLKYKTVAINTTVHI